MAAHVAAGATGRTSPHAGDDLAHLSAPELVARYQQGDRRALVELVPRMRESVIGHIAHHLSDPSDVEDLAHDVLAHALAHLDAVDPGRGLWPWLVAMANNRIIDHHRQYDTANTRVDDIRVRETLVPSTRARAEDAFETVELREQRRTLFRMLRHLAPRQRAALVLHAVHGWNADQIAELLGTNRNNVHQLLARARGRARREYLSLTGGHRPWVVVPWPLLWARDRIRRALQRSRDTVTELQGALPAAGESMTTAASMAVAVAVAAGVAWVGGPPAADAAPPHHALASMDAAAAGLIEGPADGAYSTADPASTAMSAGRPVASDALPAPTTDTAPATAQQNDDRTSDASDSLTAPAVRSPDPTVGAHAGTSDSDEFEDGKALDLHADVKTDPDNGPSGPNVSYDKNCSTATGPAECDAMDAAEGDTSLERVRDDSSSTVASSDGSTDEDVDETTSDMQEDAETFDVLTEDNCGLDDGVETVCDEAEDPSF